MAWTSMKAWKTTSGRLTWSSVHATKQVEWMGPVDRKTWLNRASKAREVFLPFRGALLEPTSCGQLGEPFFGKGGTSIATVRSNFWGWQQVFRIILVCLIVGLRISQSSGPAVSFLPGARPGR